MRYFMVKASKDNFNVYHQGRHQITLCGSELLTEKELNMYHVPDECVIPVKINKTNTFISFGTRFEKNGMEEE